jgi:hypothetical protein
MQAVPIGFMRGVIGAIGIGCAYMTARSVVSLRKGEIRISRVYAWLLRTLVCLLGVWYPARPGADTADLVIWALAAVAFAAGYREASRVKKEEDLTDQIFPHDTEPRA